MEGARAFTDTAVLVISRFSGEGWDRKSVHYEGQVSGEIHQSELSEKIFQNSDFCLTNEEAALAEQVKKAFPHVAVVLNVGGMVDTSLVAKDPGFPAVLWHGREEWKADLPWQMCSWEKSAPPESFLILLLEAWTIIRLPQISMNRRNMWNILTIFMWDTGILKP